MPDRRVESGRAGHLRRREFRFWAGLVLVVVVAGVALALWYWL